MLGRVRPSSLSSLEVLEMEERLPSKLIKHDSLSIYETTLLKLKQGSRLDLSLSPEDSTKTDLGNNTTSSCPDMEAMAIDPQCSSTCSITSSNDCQSIGPSQEQKNRNVSVLHLFSRYNRSHHALGPSDEETTMFENGFSPCDSQSPNNSQWLSHTGHHFEREFTETTLMKLKQGSRHDLSLSPEDPTKIDFGYNTASSSSDEEAMAIDPHCSSTGSITSSSDCQSISPSQEQRNRNVSVLHLFSRYKRSHRALSPSSEETTLSENGFSPSDSQSHTGHHFEREFSGL